MLISPLEDRIETLQDLTVHILQANPVSVHGGIEVTIQYIQERFVILIDQHNGTPTGLSMCGS